MFTRFGSLLSLVLLFACAPQEAAVIEDGFAHDDDACGALRFVDEAADTLLVMTPGDSGLWSAVLFQGDDERVLGEDMECDWLIGHCLSESSQEEKTESVLTFELIDEDVFSISLRTTLSVEDYGTVTDEDLIASAFVLESCDISLSW